MTPDEEPNEPESEMASPVAAGFLLEVMKGLRDTNFARGWGGLGMYEDFLAWCERSEEADGIIAQYYAEIPVLLMDEDEGLRVISLRTETATNLMKALLEAFEGERLRKLLGE